MQNTEDHTFRNTIKFMTGDNNKSPGNSSNNKDNNKNKDPEIGN